MSPNDHQKRGDEPRPLFTPSEPSERADEVTGLFNPRPQDVRPWELFERTPEVTEAFSADAIAGDEHEGDHAQEAESEGAVDDVEGAELAAEAEDLVTDPEDIDENTGTPEGDALSANADAVDPEEQALDAEVDEVPEDVESAEALSELLDETLAEPVEEAVMPCPTCEATEAAAAATLDATIEALQRPYQEGSEALQRAAQDVSKDFVQNLLRLSVELAATVLRRSAEIDPQTVLSSLDGALEIAGPLSEAVVRCHPEDAPLLREHAGARAEAITGRLVEVAVRPTEGMARGACIVDFEDGLVDARWRVQLERLAEAISPALIHHAAASAAQIVDETMRGTEAESATLDDAIPSEDDAEVSLETGEALASEAVSVLEPGDAPEGAEDAAVEEGSE